MSRSLRVQLLLSGSSLGGSCVAALLLTLLGGVVGSLRGAGTVFSQLAFMSSIFIPIALILTAFNSGGNALNLCLSLGGRRRDWFVAIQGFFLVCLVVGRVTVLLAFALVNLAGWVPPQGQNLLSLLGRPGVWQYDLLCLAGMVAGTLGGIMHLRKPEGGMLIFFLALLAAVAGLCILGLTMALAGRIPDLSGPVCLVALGVLVPGELGLWLSVRRACVV